MIRWAPSPRHLSHRLVREGVTYARLYTHLFVYEGIKGGADFYTGGEGTILSRCGDVLTLAGSCPSQGQELFCFGQSLGCPVLVCDGKAADDMGFSGSRAQILCYPQAGAPFPRKPASLGEMGYTLEPVCSLTPVFRLLCRTFPNMEPSMLEPWVWDISLKIRRGMAQVLGVYLKGELVATAGIYDQNPCCGVIGSVATLPEHRCRGLAGWVVSSLVGTLLEQGRSPLLVCRSPKALRLYDSLGFVPAGELCELSLEPPSPQG